MKKKIFFVIPLALFFIMVGFLIVGLQLDLENPFSVDWKKIPRFNFVELSTNGSVITNEDLPSTPFLLNVWASWCGACLQEHELLKKISDSGSIKVIGLNYKDSYSEATRWLLKYGDPYTKNIRS